MKRLAFSLLLLLSTLAYAGEKVLYTFQGGTDGFLPNAALIQDQAGNFYGTTYYGGDLSCVPSDGCGTVFELSPDGHGGWTEAVLYRFAGGADGQNPVAGLILDGQGNLYGTSALGAKCPKNCGSVFELSPQGGSWKFTILHTFKGGTDGQYPDGGLLMDSAGSLYGTTISGGASSRGLAFRLANTNGAWKLKKLYSFSGGTDGGDPAGTLVFGSDGSIYGLTLYGGAYGQGVLYKVFINVKGNWKEKVLYSFKGGKSGAHPYGLSLDSAGKLYGFATNTPGWGFVFQFSQNRTGKWSKKDIYKLGQPRGGGPSGPRGGLLVDAGGNVFGMAGGGITPSSGTLYKLTPQADGKFAETLLYSFQGGSDGIGPNGPPIMDASGNLYGVTAAGGGGCSGLASGCGTVFEFTP